MPCKMRLSVEFSFALTLKVPNENCSRQHFNFYALMTILSGGGVHYVLPLSVSLSFCPSIAPLKKKSLYYQLLSEFPRNQFETLHRCYKHIEDVHATFYRRENNF